MMNLLKAYLVVLDRDFVNYIKATKDNYDDGEDITIESLMQKANTIYNVSKQQGTWNSFSPKQEQ
eukprot:3929110-Ditylum_brightwellii.AAC.1